MIAQVNRRQETLVQARDLTARRQYQAAVDLCTRALAKLGEDSSIRQARARALMAQKRHVEARRDLDLCLKLQPGAAEARRMLTELALRRGDLETAVRHLNDALRLDATHPRALELSIVVYGWLARARRAAAARRDADRDTFVERRAA